MKRLYKIANIDVYATDKQIEEYATDARQYDYIRAKLGKLLADIYRIKGNTDYISCARMGNGKMMLIASSKTLKDNPQIVICKNSMFYTKVSIDTLLEFKDDMIAEWIEKKLLANVNNSMKVLSKTQSEKLIEMLRKKENLRENFMENEGDVSYEDEIME